MERRLSSSLLFVIHNVSDALVKFYMSAGMLDKASDWVNAHEVSETGLI